MDVLDFIKNYRRANEGATKRGGSVAVDNYNREMEKGVGNMKREDFVRVAQGYKDKAREYDAEDKAAQRKWEDTKDKEFALNQELEDYSRNIKAEEENLLAKQNEYDKLAKKFEGKDKNFINNYRDMVMDSSAMRYGSDADRQSMQNFFDAVSRGERYRADDSALRDAKQAYQDKYNYYQEWKDFYLPKPRGYSNTFDDDVQDSVANAEAQNNAGTDTNTQSNTNAQTGNPVLDNAKAEDIVTYTYKPGDTFGQVLRNLGLESSKGLWGSDGDVVYYTKQLLDQGLWSDNGNRPGNIPVGTTIKLVRRK